MRYIKRHGKIGSGNSLPHLFLHRLFPLLALVTAGHSFANGDVTSQISQALTAGLNQQVHRWQTNHPGRWRPHQLEITMPVGVERLQACTQPLEISNNADRFPGGQQQRQIKCTSPSWVLFARAEVTMKAQVPITAKKLSKGAVIDAESIRWRTITIEARHQSIVMSKQELIGQQTKRGIRSDSPILKSLVTAPLWVKRGELIILQAGTEDFVATSEGVALESGSEGQRIRVRNSKSGKVVSGIVIEKGKVQTFY